MIAADLGLIDLAKELGRDYFQSVISADLDVFIDEVRSFLVPILGDVSVEYSYRGGNENIGCIICRSRKEEVLSFGKVIELKRESMRELEFYQAILENFPNLKAVVPKCFGVYYRTSDNIAVIFMDPLAPLGLEKKHGLPVIEINSFIESVSGTIPKNFSVFLLIVNPSLVSSILDMGVSTLVRNKTDLKSLPMRLTAIALLGDDIFAQRYSRICQS